MTVKREIQETMGKIRKHRVDLLVKAKEAAPEKKERLKAAVAAHLETGKLADGETDRRTPGPPGPFASGDKASARTHGPGAEKTMPDDGQEEETT